MSPIIQDPLANKRIRYKDPLANKNIIYWARDAIVTIGYTGLAYGLSSSNRHMPTDEWIVQMLRGVPIKRGRDGIRPVTFANETIPRWLDIGQSVELLRDELQKALDKFHPDLKKLAFEVIVAGWQGTRPRHLQPVHVSIVKAQGKASVVIERPPRHWHLGGTIDLIDTPSDYLVNSELADLGESLRVASPDAAENYLVGTIRHVAARNPQRVGPHCISILLARPGSASIRIRFIPNTPHIAVFYDERTTQELPVAFSPWIIGPETFAAPSVNIGLGYQEMGPHRIIIEAPVPGKGLLGFTGALRRPWAP